MTIAAGILFLTKGAADAPAQALFLKRGNGGDYPGTWCFPGGHHEQGETIEETAEREAREELGTYPKGKIEPWTRAVASPAPLPIGASGTIEGPSVLPGDAIDFTTFRQQVDEPFAPTLNGEHVGWAWAPADQPPQPLHPGCAIALDRLTMDELGIARAMADGRLTSPQAYHNVTLFALRITGTGLAYRSGLKEYVWREPEHYLTDEFLQRCNGLSVIFEHPKKSLLNSKEFSDRIVGSVMLAYIKGDEVWGIAKLYDAAAIKMMSDRQLSTSPAVTWSDLSVNMVLKQDDGSKLLIEGKPQLLDHVAICARGVWDKQGEPSGVLNDNLRTMERTDMADKVEEKKAEGEDRKDADAGTKLDRLLTHMDSMHKRMDEDKAEREKFSERLDAVCGRMDSYEAARKDADEKEEKKEETKSDKARKDADADMSMADKAKADKAKADAEDEKKEAKADAEKEEEEEEEKKERADAASTEEIWKAVREVQAQIPKHMTDADYSDFTSAQSRFDSVYQEFGQHAPRFMSGETLQGYRLRMAKDLQKHSPTWKEANLGVVAVDAVAFDAALNSLFTEARRTANDPANFPQTGERTMVRRDSATGRDVTEFQRSGSFVKDFMPPPQFVTEFNTAVRN